MKKKKKITVFALPHILIPFNPPFETKRGKIENKKRKTNTQPSLQSSPPFKKRQNKLAAITS